MGGYLFDVQVFINHKEHMSIFTKVLPVLLLAAVSIVGVAAVFPVIYSNTSDPNLISYFHTDESFLMDEAWYYYSGEKRPSFIFENDVGVQVLYIARFCKLFLSKFIDFTPVTFAIILRWFNAISWAASLLIVWRFVRRHFGGNWEAFFIVILLAIRPAFPTLAGNSKPEFLVLFFMIAGLNFTLRILDDKTKRSLYLAIACASIASVIKVAGIFLLPSIVIALILSQRSRPEKKDLFSRIAKKAWLFPLFIGLIFILLPIIAILSYERQSTGLTWSQQYGFWYCITHVSLVFYSISFGFSFVIFSIILRIFNRSKIEILKKVKINLNKIFSYALPVFMLFILFTMLFGAAWVINPGSFLQSVTTMMSEAFGRDEAGVVKYGDVLVESLSGLKAKIMSFDAIFFTLFMLSIFIEIYRLRRNEKQDRLNFCKRVLLISFVLSIMCFMVLRVRLADHHMMPFFVASAILVMQELKIFYKSLNGKRMLKFAAICIISLIFAFDIFQQASASAASFVYLHHRKGDIVFDIVKWWRGNCSADTHIVADHPTYAYLPPEYKNVKYLKFVDHSNENLRNMVLSVKPKLVYYRIDRTNGMMPLEKITPELKVRLVVSFDNTGRRYQRFPESSFVIYEIEY